MSSLIGQVIGNYRIEALLGSGGMAQVYRAVHVMLNRSAAIKVMHAHYATDGGFQDRFVQEAKAVAALNHPNIVDVYDFSKQEQDGLLYLVMEYIPNGSLRTLLQRQSSGTEQLPLSLGLDLVRQAANGLAYAHSRGMVHRDIKPDNLLLADAGGHGAGWPYTVKISDFGLARLAEGGIATEAGMMMGSPAYMSPEQCESKELDGRSDLYSLGIVLYEVSTSYLPFEIKTVSDAVYKHVSVLPLPPLQVRPDLPGGLDAIILRCLAKRPADRFASGTELSTALTGIIDNLGPRPMASPSAPVVTPTWSAPDAAAPPPAPRATNRSSLPRLHVLDGNGQEQNSLAITARGVTIGRGADNVVVLTDEMVSRNHLRLDWDGQRVTVTDLGAGNGTFLGNRQLAPQAQTEWTADDWLRVGPYWLCLQPAARRDTPETRPLPVAAAPVLSPPPAVYAPPPAPPVYVPATQPIPAPAFEPAPPAAYIPPPSRQGRINVSVEEGERLSITPGQPAIVQVRLANLGTTVDHFRVTVEGIPSGWVHGPDQEIQLNPNDAVPLTLTIATARSPEYVAGEYPVTIRARSRENPAESGEAHGLWTILPYTASSIGLEPALATSRLRAGYRVALHNMGNAAGRYALAGKDDEEKLGYRFVPETVDLDPGAETTVALTVRARRKWLGRAQSRPFNVDALPSLGDPPPPVRGEWVQKAILPPWTPLVPVAMLALLVALFFWLQPSVRIFIDPASPVAGQPITVRWNVSHTRRIDLSVDGVVVARDLDPNSKGKIFEKGLGGKAVEAVARNRLGNAKATAPLTVVQPTPVPTPPPDKPVVDAFTVDKSVVLPSEKITLTWKVHNAESVTITSSTGVNDSNLKIEDTKEYTITQDTNFTITAINKGTQTATQSLFAGTSAAVATSVSQTAVVSTAASGTAAVTTAAAQSTAANSTAAAQTTIAGSTSAAQTSSAGSTSAAQTAGAGQNQAAQTAMANSNNAMGTAMANGNIGTLTAVASSNLATQTTTAATVQTQIGAPQTAQARGTATAEAHLQATQTTEALLQPTQTAQARATTTAQAQGTATVQARLQTTQTAQARATTTAQAKTTITVNEKDYAISLNASTIQAGMITFKVINDGPSLHHFKISQGTTEKKLVSVDAGKTETTDPVDLKPGTYTIICDIPGHEALGMKVTLTVT